MGNGGEDGSFSLEASLVFPIVLLTLFLLMFFCVYLYQQAILMQTAAMSSEQAAYSWDNSHKEPQTGFFKEGQYDSLYWRLYDDQLLGALFGWAGAEQERVISLPGSEQEGDLSILKMSRAGSRILNPMAGEMRYHNRLISRQVSVRLERPVTLPMLKHYMRNPELEVETQSGIVEPVEWIRSFELVRYYGARFLGRGSGAAVTPDGVGQVLKQSSPSAR
ncbi:TadE/TadG family type IV pilus assembly protein [Paenibacillus sp. JX-17]|uniref:TadE/TadG family type IV pilus assembly protein n=2 Tax=Paenibacillus lacisoli TaxID=3064525 RepID=A0ABT9CDH6_9BACL|nr:TadE/TadG family type IV pilus assembly protein [Paenibacillus sp. JX-17]MDO7907297.1 TadE/TadG family type IV pilus assembly protein [Paenibacillus sp. JX-17]